MATTIPVGTGRLILGNNLSEIINGTPSNDTIYGYAGNDSINGFEGNDYIDGGIGNDTLIGGTGNNTLVGGAGDDFLDGSLGTNDVIFGGAGFDTALYSSVAGFNTAAANGVENPFLVNIVGTANADNIVGTPFNDTISGLGGDDTISGLGGDDSINGGSGNDSIDGGSGDNTLRGSSGDDTISGLGGNDSIDGGSGDDSIDGGSGNNTLRGGSGNDIITGDGFDTITGGLGADTIICNNTQRLVYNSPGEGDVLEVIGGFDTLVIEPFSSDQFLISAIGFGGGLVAGVLGAGQFLSGAGVTVAANATQRFIFNTTDGALRYDADGNAAGASVFIATLNSIIPTSLAAADFVVF